MSALHKPCPPGCHPHADQPNWRPADNPWDYLRNCEEGLELYSNRRLAKLFGVSRVEVWRWQQMAKLPDDLFEALLKSGRNSTKSLAEAALVFEGAGREATAEICPHCGGTLRVRLRGSAAHRKIIDDWHANGGAP
jgi:hypothetical protein